MSEEKRRLSLDDEYTFACHKGLECYTSCCRDVNIFLTPHDVIRLKKALGMTSGEFLEKHTDQLVMQSSPFPLIQLKMDEANDKKCFFVTPEGCRVYPHRPWACRMFPLDERAEGGFEIVASPQRCHGLAKGDTWRVMDWLMDQGATQSKEMDGSFESIVSHERLKGMDMDNPKITQMVYTAIYDIDAFRKLVFNSSFLERFELEPELVDDCKTNDMILLDVAYAWVRMGLFGQKTLKVSESAMAKAKAAQGKD